MRGPRDGLHSGLVLVKLRQGLRAAPGAPQQQLVVVATRSQLLVVERPLEATDFLSVTDELGRVVLRAAQVSMQDAMVATSSAQERVIPGDSADASVVASHSFHQFVPLGVPDL